MTELLRLEWLTESDVFELRQRGREVAAAIGLDAQDQIRVATALSEVGREVLAGGPTTVVFSAMTTPAELVIDVLARSSGRNATEHESFAAARRLLDAVEVTDADGARRISLHKRLPHGGMAGPRELQSARRLLSQHRPSSPAEELRVQNAELISTLDELRRQQGQLVQLNEELEETNRGVVAMYTQLSEELEETNRGVVALYAELDEKGEQLAEANDAKTRFLRNVSHELRTPVNSVLGLAGLLSSGDLDEDGRTQVGYLQASARGLLELVNELLDLARAESGREPVHITDVDLAKVFTELRGTLRPVLTAPGVELIVDEPDVATLQTDAELLTRVLRNLLMNAVKFTESGHVRLSAGASESSQHVMIRVEDTGIGIAPEHQHKVFEEFFQVPGELQVEAKGTGLGLPYARRVTESLGGSITVCSTPGLGSTFTVQLPYTGTSVLTDEQLLSQLGHVLVIDDDAAFRYVVRGMLQGVAERVSESADGEAGLDDLRTLRPDIVLLDLRMPRRDGASVLAAMKADPALADIPVILMTSVDIDAEVRRAAAPAAELLAKTSIDRTRLLSLLARVLAGVPSVRTPRSTA